MLGLLPGDVAGTRLQQAWLGRSLGVRGDGLAATGAALAVLGALVAREGGLALQAEVEHPFGQGVANGDGDILRLSQRGAPGGPLGAPEAVGKVFGDALDVGADFFYFRCPLLGVCHPWLLI